METESALGFRSEMRYDKVGKRLRSIIPISTTVSATNIYEYDDLDRLDKTTDPLGGITTQRYDSEGGMTESEDARLVKTRMEYDATGRMEKVIAEQLRTAAFHI